MLVKMVKDQKGFKLWSLLHKTLDII